MRSGGINDIASLNKVTGDPVPLMVDFSQVWLCLTASIDSGVAPWMETAAGGWADGARGLAGEQEHLTVTIGRVGHRHGRY